MTEQTFDTIKVNRTGRVITIELNRPDALNALNSKMTEEVTSYLTSLDEDKDTGCFVLTGTGKAFAAGADIKEMAAKSYMDTFYENMFAKWETIAQLRTPKIAAVNGFALGGGCELAMMCDILFAGTSAKFGQPEIKLGVIPGMGGSQRLTRAVGKAKAMDMILTGRMMDAEEAERSGLVARIFPDEALITETMAVAEMIAEFGPASAMLAREAVARADEISLTEGLLFERRVFHSLFATKDQKEGMAAFTQKRSATFTGE
jgi:enoyl-CoA hydratase